MASRRAGQYRFFLLLTNVLLFPAVIFASEDLSETATLSTNIITVGFTGFGILALYVAFLTVKFLMGALKESAKAKKEEAAKAGASHEKEGQVSLSIALGLGSLFAVLAIGILFIVFLFVQTGLDLSATKSLSSFIITMGFGGFFLLFLYLVVLIATALWKAIVKPKKPVEAPAQEGVPFLQPVTRRCLVSLLGWAWVAFTAATMGALTTCLRFFFPNVTFEPPLKFKCGFPNTYSIGVDQRLKESNRVWIVRSSEGFYALSTICTHLGCTPNWLEAEQKFKCPCHGSGFYTSGINFEGPAPRPLPRFNITLADDGQIQIDEGTQYQQELGQWGLPGSFLEYKA